jgi:hypothetical protein
MELNKLYITLDGHEFEALLKSALIDLREPKEEARFLLRSELQRRGLINNYSEVNTTEKIKVEEGSSVKSAR